MPNDKARNAPAFRFRIQFVESKTAPACISTEQTKVFMIQDFKFALRQLLKAPGFTATAVLTLALAIGVNSAIFALINGVVLHPIVPLRPQEVVNVYNCRQNANHDYRAFSYNEFRELQQNGGDLFVDIAGLEFAVAGIGRNHEMRRSFVFLTSENYFSLMRSQLGSTLDDSESMRDLNSPKVYALNLVGRMRPGVTIESAKSRLPVISQRFNSMQGDGAEFQREVQVHAPSRFDLSTSPPDSNPITLIATLLMAMAGAVLLIACLNLANMLLARGTTRAKEIALRLALGASRWQIIKQLLAEGLLLAICGGVVGLVLSVWCNNLLLNSLAALLNNINFSFILDLRPNVPILAVTFLFCLLATVLFSLGPALKATRADLVNDLKQQVGEPARIGRLSRFFAPRHISVMAQIALSLMLLFAAGLFFRGALKAAGLNPGFVASGDIISEFDFTLIKTTPADSRRLIFAMVECARELPGVWAAAIGTMLPYSDFITARRVLRAKDSMPNDPKAPDPSVNSLYTAITPGYCEALGIKLLRGRDFTQSESETKDARRVAIIDEEMAKKLFPNEDPIGQHIRYTNPPKDGSPNDMEIVGIVNKHRHSVDNDSLVCRLFVPLAQGYSGQTFLHVRLNTEDRHAVAAFIPTLRKLRLRSDPNFRCHR